MSIPWRSTQRFRNCFARNSQGFAVAASGPAYIQMLAHTQYGPTPSSFATATFGFAAVSKYACNSYGLITASRQLRNSFATASEELREMFLNKFATFSQKLRGVIGTASEHASRLRNQHCNSFVTSSQRLRNSIATASEQLRNLIIAP